MDAERERVAVPQAVPLALAVGQKEGLAVAVDKLPDCEGETESEGVAEPLRLGAATLGDCEADTLGDGEALPVTQPVPEALPLRLAVLQPLGEGDTEGEAEGDRETVAEAQGEPLSVVLALALRVALAQPLPESERRDEAQCVLLKLTVREADGEALCEGVMVGERDCGPEPEGEGDTEGEGVVVADSEPEWLPLPLCVPLPLREGVGEALGEALGEREALREGSALRLPRAGEALAVRVRWGEAEALREGAMVADTKGASVAAAVALAGAEGEALAEGEGAADCSASNVPAAATVMPAPVTSPRRSRPVLALASPPAGAPMSTSAVRPCSPKSSCLGAPPLPPLRPGSKASEDHSSAPVGALSANITPSLPRQASVPLPSLVGGSSSATPGGSA